MKDKSTYNRATKRVSVLMEMLRGGESGYNGKVRQNDS